MNWTILVVDDDEEDFLLLNQHIQKCHQHVTLTYVPAGEDLLKKLQTVPAPGLIILDAKMPLMNGYETIKSVRAVPAYQHIPVLIWSGTLSNADITLFHRAGANSVVLKQSLFRQVDVFCNYWLELAESPTAQ